MATGTKVFSFGWIQPVFHIKINMKEEKSLFQMCNMLLHKIDISKCNKDFTSAISNIILLRVHPSEQQVMKYSSDCSRTKESMRIQDKTVSLRMVKTMLVVSSTFILLWTPMLVTMVRWYFNKFLCVKN